ncbi:hypothetical protein Hydth_0889 [Hydrogenobacter thermophilus TK-6]|uniref:Uncharacterized protein n=1 Tax=Hydrogenobacter thermophilus (strain DSM 6534 / IAM 12695 / TK-6) TaxID=608538 RepID=D3DHP6_HYDTT|nr:hypothetical protein [Hydrogenobacter thermophilus]ADO45285.1 hypothetical protein Hydth_0889 [Hydrogenobacter thermophilus TK-6]BAI69348.1 hypothetical protein HTH_0889 [Hydrogenobacter thermophilus TK-6]
MSTSYFFPCLIDGVPKDKTISVEIQARENSFFKSANIEFINYTPPSELAISAAGGFLFRGRLKSAQQKPCGRVSAYYETSLNCSDIPPTVILTPWALNALTWSSLRDLITQLVAVDIGGYPWQAPPSFVDSQASGSPIRYYLFYDDVIGPAGSIATGYMPPPNWRDFYSIANMEWALSTVVRMEASKYASDDLVFIRLAYVWYRDVFSNNPASYGYATASASIVPNATSYRVITNAITARDVFQALGALLNTSSSALFIRPIIVKDAGDIVQVLRKFPQNIIIKVDENGQLVGTDVDNIQNTFVLSDSVVFDYSLPKMRQVSVTMRAEGESWRYTVKAKDAYSCPVATLEVNNSDVIIQSTEDINRLLKHFKLNLQERGHIKCVLLPDVDLYHRVDFQGRTFRVVGYTHRISRNEATTDLTIIEEVS